MASPPRPEPDEGIFETLLVADGRPIELEAHLARLAVSLHDLYGIDSVAEARRLIAEAAGDMALGRLRLSAIPDNDRKDGIAFSISGSTVAPDSVLHPYGSPAALQTVAVPGGIGRHKWANRALLEELEEGVSDGRPGSAGRNSGGQRSPEGVPLLVDERGFVLETSRANVFAVRDGVLVTPPADGRILPGTVRARLLRSAGELGLEVSESEIHHNELNDAEEVFLTSSVRGVVAAVALDNAELQSVGAVTQRVAEALRNRWLGR